MDKEESKKLNIIFSFLNDLAKQLAEKIKDAGSQQNKEILLELNEMIEDLKKTIEESGEKMPKVEIATSPMMSQIKQYKVEVQPQIEIPPFPKFPEFPKIPEFPKEISIKEASSIIAVLSRIVSEIQQKNVRIDLTAVERRITDLQNRISKDIEELKYAIPKVPDLGLPMDQERIKVILPDKQVAQMGGGGGSSVVSIRGSANNGDGTKTVAASGTPVQLPDQPCRRVFIQAHESNTEAIVVGGSTVVASMSGRRGLSLFSTQGDWFQVSNLNLLYIDSMVDGEKIIYYYEK